MTYTVPDFGPNDLLDSEKIGVRRVKTSIDPEIKAGILENLGPFGQSRTVEYTPLIELKSIYGTSILRDKVILTGAASLDETGPEIILNANGATARVNSAERGRYLSGSIGVAGLGTRIVALPSQSGDYAEWGYFNDNNGFGFGVDLDGVYIWVQRGGAIVEKTYQQDWNVDKLDGTGPSGANIDLEDGNVFQLPFLWYGYGSIRFEIIERQTLYDRKISAHSSSFRGSVSVNDPNLPISVRCAGNCSIAIGGRQYGVYGRYEPSRRIVSDVRINRSVSTAFVPLVSFRDKGGTFESVSIKLQGLDILTEEDLVISIRINSTLTGADFRDPPDHTETATEYDISATAITGGEQIFLDLAAGAVGATSTLTTTQLPKLDIPVDSVVTVCARTVSGTASVTTVLRDRQEW